MHCFQLSFSLFFPVSSAKSGQIFFPSIFPSLYSIICPSSMCICSCGYLIIYKLMKISQIFHIITTSMSIPNETHELYSHCTLMKIPKKNKQTQHRIFQINIQKPSFPKKKKQKQRKITDKNNP